MRPSIIFFGSFLEYSVQTLEKLYKSNSINLMGVVTTPPMPAGRQKLPKKTNVQLYAETYHIPLFTPDELNDKTLDALRSTLDDQPNLFLVAGYGKLLPPSWLNFPKTRALNVHFSLLPSYRGANPAEWAILRGETKTGVTLIEMSEKFDEGNIISQSEIPIKPTDTRETLYHKLYDLGGELTLETLPNYLNQQITSQPQGESPTPYARRLSRDDSQIPWQIISAAMSGQQIDPQSLPTLLKEVYDPRSTSYDLLERAIRALTGFPGVWTVVKTNKGDKRLKIHSAHLENNQLVLDQVQLEGQKISTFNQIKNQILD